MRPLRNLFEIFYICLVLAFIVDYSVAICCRPYADLKLFISMSFRLLGINVLLLIKEQPRRVFSNKYQFSNLKYDINNYITF